MNHKIELLAPAGNMESLIAAVNGGADAIYLGLKNFSARAFAGNFSHEEFQEAIRYCHTRNVRIYVTINTMLFEQEVNNAIEEIDFLYHNDCDGVLIQDLGLFHYVRSCYPDFDVHCSTQMHIHNLDGVKYMKNEGVKRVVMARETPISIVKQACQLGVEVEIFAYGAICISYSGQCLMSQAIKNRSANRGMCAQCCRLKYYPDENHEFEEGEYILSPRDLNTIDQIPQFIEAGVASLKIEGRMKRPEYVWLVTNTYRQAIDAYYRGEKFVLSKQREKELLLMFNRGFSAGHLFGDDVEHRMSQYRPNHQGVSIGTVMSYYNGRVQVKLHDELHQHDGLRILNEPNDTGLTAVKIFKNEKLVNHAEKGDVVWLECHSKPYPKKGQSLQKTSDTALMKEIRTYMDAHPRKSEISVTYEARINHPFVLNIRDTDGHVITMQSEQILEAAKKIPTTNETIERSIRKTDEYPYEIASIEGVLENVFIPVSVLNDVRRNALELLHMTRAVLNPREGRKTYSCTLQKPENELAKILVKSERDIQDERCNVYSEGYGDHKILPVINENMNETLHMDDVILSSINDLQHETTNAIAGMNMNLANSYAIAYVLSKGVCGVILSSEMNNLQIKTTLDAFEDRYGFTPMTYRLVYGKRVAMYIKDGFRKDRSLKEMSDFHGNLFKISYNSCVTEISEPDVYHSDNPYCYGSYLILDEESSIDQKEIITEAYEELHERI